jgi:hypothetical protein
LPWHEAKALQEVPVTTMVQGKQSSVDTCDHHKIECVILPNQFSLHNLGLSVLVTCSVNG